MEEAGGGPSRKTLEQANWVVAGPRGAAVRLGMKRSTVCFRMQKLGISRDVARRQERKNVCAQRRGVRISIDPNWVPTCNFALINTEGMEAFVRNSWSNCPEPGFWPPHRCLSYVPGNLIE